MRASSEEVTKELSGLRVCVVYDCLFPWTTGGAERWYRELAERLADAGADVQYLTRLQWDDSDSPSIPGVDVITVMGRQELYLEDGTRKLGPPLRFGWGVFLWLVRHRRDVDAVHVANFPFFSLLAIRLALARSDVEVYVDWHEVWPLHFWRSYAGRISGLFGWVIQWLCIRATPHALVFWSHNADRLRLHRYRGDVTTLPGLLVNAEVPDVAPRAEGGEPGDVLVLFVGRLIKDKGARSLPGTLQIALRAEPRLRLAVVGSGPEQELLSAEFDDLDLTNKVEFFGSVGDEELASLRAAAACTIVPSIREGYGMAVVESMAAGTPVVIANNPENLAVHHVDAGVNGFVVDPAPRALADGILRAIRMGEPLRATTRLWFEEHAGLMSIDGSLAAVVDLYVKTKASRPAAR